VAEDVTDEEVLRSLVGFGAALQHAAGSGPQAFDVGAVLGGAAAKGAIAGIINVRVDANFVTPGDLLKSPSLTEVGRRRP
jgi:hypothetical protein